MKIIIWNIQKINAEKAAQFAPRIGEIIVGIVGDEPFILVVLENKTYPTRTLEAIGTGLHVDQLTSRFVNLGGSSTLKEYGLIFAGNGASFSAPEPYTGWQATFDERCRKMHENEVHRASLEWHRLNETRSVRASTSSARDQRLETAKQGSFRSAADFRNPVSITAKFDGETVRFLALHAPGPSLGDEHEDPYAVVYAQSILQTAHGYAMILGDFNLRSTMSYVGGFVDMGVRTGATTKGKEQGRHTYSRLDRAYCRSGVPVTVELFTDGPDSELTDHHCMVVTLQRRAQRLMTDFFAFEPSPVRRQAIRRINKDDAEQRRRSGYKHGYDPKSGTERRRANVEANRKKAREDLLRGKRGLPDA